MSTIFRNAWRQIGNSPGFSLLAILMLAIGVGACTAMFSIVNTVLIKPLPFEQPQQLAWIENNGSGGGMSDRTSQVYNLMDWQAQSQSFESIGAYYAFFEYLQYTLTLNGESERLLGVPVTQNFFDVLGVQPALGRGFLDSEMDWTQGEVRAAILSHAFWTERFAADPTIVGQTVTINKTPVVVTGVMPRDFDFDSVFTPESSVQMLLPFPLVEAMHNEGNTLFAVGRLKSGVSLGQAQAELDAISARVAANHPERGPFGAVLSDLNEQVRGSFRPAFLILFGAVLCLLLIVCLNLSNLLLTRAQARRKEWLTRVALGASRWQLIRQPLVESLLLAGIGGLLGLGLAKLAMDALAQMQTFSIPLLHGAGLDTASVAFTALAAAMAGLICGVFPALQLWHTDASAALNESGTRGSAGPAAARVRKTLVVSQIALACALLIASGLLIRSFVEVLGIEMGFEPDHVVAWRVDSARPFETNQERVDYYRSLLDGVRALPGVESVGLSDTLPFGRNRGWGAAAKGEEYEPDNYPTAAPRMVDQGYLQTLQVPLLQGRYFDQRDVASDDLRGMIVNQTMARQLWPGRDPLGQIVVSGSNEMGRVIGVVADIPRSLERTPNPEMYFNITQINDWSSVEMVVRSSRTTSALIPDVRNVIRNHDPEMATGDVYTLNQIVDKAIAPRRLTTSVLGAFSALALLLAGLGVYGVVAYSVGQRDKEMAIRVALGGRGLDVARLILNEGVIVAVIGAAIGLVIALVGTRLMQSLLYGVSPFDPAIFAGYTGVVALVALLATVIPALRAARTNPVGALR